MKITIDMLMEKDSESSQNPYRISKTPIDLKKEFQKMIFRSVYAAVEFGDLYLGIPNKAQVTK